MRRASTRSAGCGRVSAGAKVLANARDQLTQSFPQQFQTFGAVAGQLAQLVSLGLPLDEWQTYLSRVDRIDEAAVRRAARSQIHPDQLLIVIAGDREKIEPDLRELGLGEIRVLSQSDLQASL